MEHQATAKLEGGSGMIAQALNERLTEEGLKRIIAKNSSYSRRQIDRLQLDDLGRSIGYGPRVRVTSKGHRYGKKAISGVHRKIKAAKKAAMLPKPRQNYWARVKKELRILICTDDKKYDTVRSYIPKGKSQNVVVSSLALAISSRIGIDAAVITSAVAAGLLIFLKVGINAYCAK
jgi:hypothetical protein